MDDTFAGIFHEKFRSVPWENGDKQWPHERQRFSGEARKKKGGGGKGR